MGILDGVPTEFRKSVTDDGRQVSLTDKSLTEFPLWVRGLTGLTRLELSGTAVSAIPEWIGELTGLTHLDLTRNRLETLPESLGNLSSLTIVTLANNRFAELPKSLYELPALVSMDLGYNPEFRELPARISGLASLTHLTLCDTRLTALPESIGSLARLKHLDLENCSLTELPGSIGNLQHLATLNLRGNRLQAPPASIARLPGLAQLDLRDNQLASVDPRWAEHLRRGVDVRLNGNPLRDPLPEIVSRGPKALLAYLESLDDAIAQYEAKLIMVGEGEVGKTSLAAALHGDPFVAGRSTTHGIEIRLITVRHPEPKLERDITLRAWDFGGQEVYRISHQFFFSKNAIYLVVWVPRQGQDQGDVAGWLRSVRLRTTGEARAMVVATHCEERRAELDFPSLQRAFPGMLVASLGVDNSTGTGIPELATAIASQAAGLPQMGQQVSRRWLAAREEILAKKDADPQISFGEFLAVCARYDMDEQQALTLAQLMHDLGQIVYYSDDDGLRDIVVLDPEWLTKAISYVLEDQETRDHAGILDHARLREIWKDRPDSPSYPPRYHPYFLRLMEKFDISYRLGDDAPQSIVAQLVPYQRPTLPWGFSTGPADHGSLPAGDPAPVGAAAGIRTLSLVCRLAEPAFGLIPWLTVRLHDASTGLHWRRGLFLRLPIPMYQSEALVEFRGNTDLVVEVRAPAPDYFFSHIRYSIEELITSRWPGLSYELLIPCPGTSPDGTPCPGLFPLDGVMKRRERGKADFPCLKCAEDYEVSLLLTGFPLPNASLRAELDQVQQTLANIGGKVADVGSTTAGIKEQVAHVESGVHEQLDRIEDGIAGLDEVPQQLASLDNAVTSVRGDVAQYAATTANLLHRVLRATNEEGKDCPRLFTVASIKATGLRRLNFLQEHYRLNLWCEHPSYWHAWAPATYSVHQPREWIANLAPYAALILSTLSLAVPVAGPVTASILIPADQLQQARDDLELMRGVLQEVAIQAAKDAAYEATAEAVRNKAESAGLKVHYDAAYSAALVPDGTVAEFGITRAEGRGLAALRTTLFQKLDRARAFGGLRRVQTSTGDFLWVCPDHYRAYDPGLPVVP